MSRGPELEALLREHAASDAVETRHRDRMLGLLAGTADPFSRSSFRPGHFTASAFVLSPDGSALLLIHHAKLSRWLQPGGHVEAGDANVTAAARRELAEEVGLEQLALEHPGIFDLDVHAIPALGGEPMHEHFDVRYLFTSRSDADPAASDDPTRPMRWSSFEEAVSLGIDASLERALRKAKQRLRRELA